MALESGTYIKDLVDTNPPGTDAISQGDDHIRLIKSVLQNSFPSTNNAAIIPDVSGNGLKYLQVNSGATATQWTSIRQRGYVSRSSFEYSSTTAILIGAGEYEIDDGSAPTNYYWDSQITFTIGSGGSNSASSAAGTSQWQYIYIDDSAISASPLVAASFLNSTTAPTYNQTKHGWYNGSDRCIFALYIDSSGDIEKFDHDGGNLVLYEDDFSEGSMSTTGTWTAKTLAGIPSFSTRAEATFYVNGTTPVAGPGYHYWRKYGTTGQHILGRTEDDEAEFTVNGVPIFTDSDRKIELYMGTTSTSINTYLTGFYIPGGM